MADNKKTINLRTNNDRVPVDRPCINPHYEVENFKPYIQDERDRFVL